MNLEWIAEDSETLAHTAQLEIGGRKTTSPIHAVTSRDLEIYKKVKGSNELNDINIVVAGETLAYSTFMGVGHNRSVTDGLFNRMKAKIVQDKINLIHPRISKEYKVGTLTFSPNGLSPLQTAGLVGIQLEAEASAIIPPLPSGLRSIDVFKDIYERTKIENQTWKKEKEVIGYVPTTEELSIVPDMIKTYLKDGVKFFAVDFSSSPLNRWLTRTVVSQIRKDLKIKGKVGEKKDKQYYLHIFNVSPSKKSPLPVAPMMDVLTHAYGVDSTSGVIWGGGNIIKDKLRYYNMQDYGAYQINALDKENVPYDKHLVTGNKIDVYEKLRANRLLGYKNECKVIADAIANTPIPSYAPHLSSKRRVAAEVKNVFLDIKEIMARSN